MLQKDFSKILIIVIVLVLLGGSILIWQWPENQLEELDEITSPTVIGENNPPAGIEPPIVEDETDGWQTYRNEELGFEFEIKYPEDMEVYQSPRYAQEGLDRRKVRFSNDYCGTHVIVHKNLSNSTPTDFFENTGKSICWNFNKHIESKEEINISGYDGIRVVFKMCPPGAGHGNSVYLSGAGKALEYAMGDEYQAFGGQENINKCRDISNLMLSSFQFLPLSSPEIEEASGIIKSVYSRSGKNYIDIDYVEFNLDWVPGGIGEPAYQNNNPKIRTFEISSNAKFIVGSPATISVIFTEFQKIFIDFDSFYYQRDGLWDIIIIDGMVASITEHFIP